MDTSRQERQLKALMARTSQALSAALNQLTSKAPLQGKLSTIVTSLELVHKVPDSFVSTSTSVIQRCLDYAIPAKLWQMADRQFHLLQAGDLQFQNFITKSLSSTLQVMLRFATSLPGELVIKVAWSQMLPVSGFEKQGMQP